MFILLPKIKTSTWWFRQQFSIWAIWAKLENRKRSVWILDKICGLHRVLNLAILHGCSQWTSPNTTMNVYLHSKGVEDQTKAAFELFRENWQERDFIDYSTPFSDARSLRSFRIFQNKKLVTGHKLCWLNKFDENLKNNK